MRAPKPVSSVSLDLLYSFIGVISNNENREGTMAQTLFPKIMNGFEQHPIIDHEVLPRSIRATTRERHDPPIISSYLKEWKMRSYRLLFCPGELEREVQDNLSDLQRNSVQSEKTSKPPLQSEEEESWRQSLLRARQAQAPTNDLTCEFMNCRENPHSYDSNDYFYWRWYKRHSQMRKSWGEHCRSSLDWEWNPSRSLKHLFKIGDSLEVTINETRSNPPKVVHVCYTTEAGEVKYVYDILYWRI